MIVNIKAKINFQLYNHLKMIVDEDISYLNYKKMRDMGMNKIIFDKDNTLTSYFSTVFRNIRVE